MPKAKPMRGMGIIADPHRGPVKKRGGKRPARPGWGQALLGRSRRGWSHGGGVGVGPGIPMNTIDVSTPAGRRKHGALGQYTGPIGVRKIGTAEAKAAQANRAKRQASRSPGGWNTGGATKYSNEFLEGQGVDPAWYRKANRKLMKQKRQNILSGKSVRTPPPKRKTISTKKGGGGWASGGEAVYTSGKFEGIPKKLLRQGRKGIRHAKKKYDKKAKSGPRTGEAVSGAKRSSGGWSLGGALNSKRKGYQSGRTVNPRAAGEKAMKTQRRMQWNARTTPIPAGWGAYGSPHSSNARFPTPPGGWNRGGPAKFRDDQSLGIRGGVVRKPVGYQGGGTSKYSDEYLQSQGVDPSMYRTANRKLMRQKRQNILSGKSVRTPAPKRKAISTKKGGGGWNTGGILATHPQAGKPMRIAKPKKHKPQILKRVPSKRSKAKKKYLSKGRGG